MSPANRRTILLAAFVLTVSVIGSVALTAVDIDVLGSEPDPDELVTDVVDAHGDVDTLQATRNAAYEIHDLDADEPRTGETTADVWKRLPDQSRTEVVVADAPERTPGDIRVVDGSTLQNYDASQESMLVDDEWDGDAVSYWPVTTENLDDTDLETTYLGTEPVDGRETNVVEIEPGANGSITGISLLVGDTEFALEFGDTVDERNVTRTTIWWIDAEMGFPIKERVVTEHDTPGKHVLERERSVRTVTYENVTFNEEINDERFVLEPPAGTDVYEPAESFDVATVPAADDAVPFAVEEPAVPDGFEFVFVGAREFRGVTTVDVLYRDGNLRDGEEIFVRLSDGPFDRDDVVETDVGPYDGSLVSTGHGPGYTWTCGEVHYDLIADDEGGEDEQFAMHLADSIDCPAE